VRVGLATVSPRLPSLIFQQVFGLGLTLARGASSNDVELLVLRATRTPSRVAATRRPDYADRAVVAALISRLPKAVRGSRMVIPGHNAALAPHLMRGRWTYPNRPGRPSLNSAIAARQPLRTPRAAHRVLPTSGTDPLSRGSSASHKTRGGSHNKTDDDWTKVVLHL
jgi:hypothetical protein